MHTFRKILCPVDYSDASRLGLRVAIQWAQIFHAQLLVMHVIPPSPPQVIDLALPVPVDLPLEVEIRSNAEAQLDGYAREWVLQGVPVKTQIVLGAPGLEIVEVAKKEASDLIVMSTHGHSGWKHLILGSVAESVVRHAPCPVLTVGPNYSRNEVVEPAAQAAETPHKEASESDHAGDDF